MAISKNISASELRAVRWFNFKETRSIRFQPVSDYYMVDVHSYKAVQVFFQAAPCSMDDLGECRMCSAYDIRKNLFVQAWDEDDGLTKFLKLSKTAARQFIELIEDEKVEPTTTVFQIERWFPDEAKQNNPKFNMRVVEREQPPKESDLGDLYDTILTWMDPKHLERFVPKFDKLTVKYSDRNESLFEGERGEAVWQICEVEI
jgi:hypothetical protein